MPCDEVSSALSGFSVCEDTPDGARIATHCLYPSFEPVYIYVSKLGDGYRVHDGRGAFEAACLHGRDRAIATSALSHESAHYHLEISDCSLVANVPSFEWLEAAILSVANASALAANRAVARAVAAAEKELRERIGDSLAHTVGAANLQKNYVARGKSGKEYAFDFAVRLGPEFGLLINGVAPHPTSVATNYVAFADAGGDQSHKFVVYDRQLDTGDVALLEQVASIVPLSSLAAGTRKATSWVVTP
jgi:hypothetical protein